MSTEKQIPDNFAKAIGRLHDDPRPLTLQSTRFQLWCLVGAVQLACRHPSFTGSARTVAEQVAREISDCLTASDNDLRQLAAMGWQQAFDEPIGRKAYTIISDCHCIICHRCGTRSTHPDDIDNRYCPHCHVFHSA